MRKIIKAIKILVLILSLSSCKNCTGVFYGVNERQYLNINLEESKFKSTFLSHYIDEVYSKKNIIPDSIIHLFPSGKYSDSINKVIYFKTFPKEAYYVGFNATPPWLIYIFNKRISGGVIDSKEQLSKEDILRIKRRFKTEIIDQATIYVREHRIPDSLVYTNY